MKAGYGKAGKQKTLSNFPTATMTTNYNYLWDTDSEGKVSLTVIYGDKGSGTCSLQKSYSEPKSLPVLTNPNARDWRKPLLICGSRRENRLSDAQAF